MIKKICSCGEGLPPVIEIHGGLRASPQWSKKLNLDAKLKKTSSSSGAIIRAKLLLMNNDQLYLGKYS